MGVDFESFKKKIILSLGAEWFDDNPDTLDRYSEHTLPGEKRRPLAVIYPGSTEDVADVVRVANETKVPLFPLSAGNSIGMGSRTAPSSRMVAVDLGRRMNRILEVNDELCYVVVEPGVTFQMLHDEFSRLGDKLMVSATSGPPHGSVLGNAVDKGAGYGPYFDHFGMMCGMEVVLGTGETIRTGDGSLASGKLVNWHVSKYSFGPILDGLFAQSNYGIVTRAGFWVMPRPPAVKSFHFVFDQDEDIGKIVDLCRPLKMSNFVPTLFRISNDLYSMATECVNPEYSTSNKEAISSEARRSIQREAGLGAWQVSGCFFGGSDAALGPSIERVKNHFGRAGGRYISHEDALDVPALQIAINSMTGRPSSEELGMLSWRPGGGNAWFLPGMPMDGKTAIELDRLGRAIYAKHGMDYIVMHVAGARFARGLHVLVWNKDDPDEDQRANACYVELTHAFAQRGIGVGRAPNNYYDTHMSLLEPEFRKLCRSVKSALDPNNIIAPGKYGI